MRSNREPATPQPRIHPALRRLRICKRYPDVAAPTEYHRARPFPIVTLRGRWLHAAGFHIGDRIQIAVTPGRLVITHLDDAPYPSLAPPSPGPLAPRNARPPDGSPYSSREPTPSPGAAGRRAP